MNQSEPPHRRGGAGRQMRGLWLARELPFPLNTGDHIYTAYLAKAVAESGCDLTFVGFPPLESASPPSDWPIRWKIISGRKNGKMRALLSSMPHVAAAHATSAYRRVIKELGQDQWDFIVVDQYGMGWAIPILQRRTDAAKLVYISHDHETSVTKLIYQKFQGPWWKRLLYWQNHVKTARIEDWIAKNTHLLTMISAADVVTFTAQVPNVQTVLLTPGYASAHAAPRTINSKTPRNVLMVGSYQWIAKQENLRRFAEAADAPFMEHGIELHVVGSMPQALASDLTSNFRAIRLHGFVESLMPHFENARVAAVPEDIGGGFKLKFLDYAFNRVPIATLTHAADGIPSDLIKTMRCAPDINSLVKSIVELIDQTEELNTMQQRAFDAAGENFDWATRGASFLDAVEGCNLQES